jgi:hypothetical protein
MQNFTRELGAGAQLLGGPLPSCLACLDHDGAHGRNHGHGHQTENERKDSRAEALHHRDVGLSASIIESPA